ncbi:hypothetical protein M0657_010574 [Pyricularia oryzae]|uniref:Uncharacterized protein n=2 Tax=Pyricularia oryzae TaxID=318829 RepID=A0AA97PH10_PYRO3|nr:hypothetical protein OOU_Y34scaffold00771g7 [Pyricularia oryzae Y34]KAI7911339.1 hypothetical protein M9X92_010573 [Pyricularia oryzae]KAI7912170.1 hypothetical protein M0657_010574 [Pyricularia oryzae]
MQFGTAFAVVFTATSFSTVLAGLGCTYSLYNNIGRQLVSYAPVSPGGTIDYKIGRTTHKLKFADTCEFEKSVPRLPDYWKVFGHVEGQMMPVE